MAANTLDSGAVEAAPESAMRRRRNSRRGRNNGRCGNDMAVEDNKRFAGHAHDACGCDQTQARPMKIHLLENFRALFYAPFYATFALGAFEAEGVDVELKSPSGFGNSLAALAAGEAEVSWGGPMRLMLARDKDAGASGVAFCEVVGRDPFYLIGRAPNPSFRMRDLLQAKVATVSELATPWICLQHDMRLAGEDPARIQRVADQSMASNVEALKRGE